ncbi:NAD(P)/FAD-dependent oxidoreductase [Ramlibacter sp. USB13]|uniref:NAD(P)/FAD-dependent oxidoreductase n=1 Tax=Ramlibacter cellulosilyticus TaxID=2764187 RepID=A0A923MNF8_9BURK|nr:NAD(P)/FAD-dependent oxidoreductase [Ramlibacter cellulosilyticus]MBC5782882.1 NAD(P)/FAD-dependent oxidoreductase [Ramlibacter cellulosilyticus]
MTTAPARIAVIGAGPMGLAVAYELAKKGDAVTVFERDGRIGGMTAAVDFGGVQIERYYHFVCGPDETTFAYLKEFGLFDRLKWTDTHMGFYFDGKLYDWGHPFALLRFPGLTMPEKVRYGLHVMRAKGIRDWKPYDTFSSTKWIKDAIGERAYNVMWKSLFHYKFYEYQDSLSAAWLGTRIKRVALSRKNLFQERLGYIEGGSEVLIDAIARRIRELGGRIELNAGVQEIVSAGGRVTGVRVDGTEQPFDQVISTVPLPYLSRMTPGLPAEERRKLEAIRNVGVVCVLLKLKRPFTRNFWMNINDPRIEIPGLIEYSNLNPSVGATILYAPFYMPQTHAKYRRPFQEFVDETIAAMRRIRPDWDPADVVDSMASRYEYSQTVCSPGFFDALPPMRSGLEGLFLADTSHYYPEDRSIQESVKLGQHLAGLAQSARPA